MGDAATSGRLEPSFWHDTLAPYATPDARRGLVDVATSAVPYLALTALMYALLDVSPLLVVALAVPAAGFLVRTFVVFHDCAHGSFLPWRRVNTWLGVACGVLVYTPFHAWRHEHAVHHATAGDLDRRGMGDLDTLTVAEYMRLRGRQQLAYRLMRNPLVMLGLGPLWALILQPRLVPSWARKRFGRKIIATNLALLALISGLCALAGWRAVLLVQLTPAMLAGAVGIWMFYVQHQFEDVYWERKERWSYAASALQGSSHLRLPKVFQFFTGNIGLHHVHHLSARIPNYNLQRAHDENPVFHDTRQLSLWDAVLALRLKLYDERSGRLVSFAEAHRHASRPPPRPTFRQRPTRSNPNAGGFDLGIVQLDRNGRLRFSSYLGGSGDDDAAPALDQRGDVYASGVTSSTDFPVTPGASQPTDGGGDIDGLLAKVTLTRWSRMDAP